jgi:hypothetical protein
MGLPVDGLFGARVGDGQDNSDLLNALPPHRCRRLERLAFIRRQITHGVSRAGYFVPRPVPGPRESIAANLTSIRLQLQMRIHVAIHVAGQAERLSALFTDMGLQTRVNGHVFCQVTDSRELFLADGAGVWTLQCVHAHVNHQVAGRRDTMTASLADKSLLLHMCEHVSGNAVFALEFHVTNGTGVRAGVGM